MAGRLHSLRRRGDVPMAPSHTGAESHGPHVARGDAASCTARAAALDDDFRREGFDVVP